MYTLNIEIKDSSNDRIPDNVKNAVIASLRNLRTAYPSVEIKTQLIENDSFDQEIKN